MSDYVPKWSMVLWHTKPPTYDVLLTKDTKKNTTTGKFQAKQDSKWYAVDIIKQSDDESWIRSLECDIQGNVLKKGKNQKNFNERDTALLGRKWIGADSTKKGKGEESDEQMKISRARLKTSSGDKNGETTNVRVSSGNSLISMTRRNNNSWKTQTKRRDENDDIKGCSSSADNRLARGTIDKKEKKLPTIKESDDSPEQDTSDFEDENMDKRRSGENSVEEDAGELIDKWFQLPDRLKPSIRRRKEAVKTKTSDEDVSGKIPDDVDLSETQENDDFNSILHEKSHTKMKKRRIHEPVKKNTEMSKIKEEERSKQNKSGKKSIDQVIVEKKVERFDPPRVIQKLQDGRAKTTPLKTNRGEMSDKTDDTKGKKSENLAKKVDEILEGDDENLMKLYQKIREILVQRGLIQSPEGKTEIYPGSGVFCNSTDFANITEKFLFNPSLLSTSLMELVMGTDLIGKTAKGWGKTEKIPTHIFNAVRNAVNSVTKKRKLHLSDKDYTRIITQFLNRTHAKLNVKPGKIKNEIESLAVKDDEEKCEESENDLHSIVNDEERDLEENSDVEPQHSDRQEEFGDIRNFGVNFRAKAKVSTEISGKNEKKDRNSDGNKKQLKEAQVVRQNKKSESDTDDTKTEKKVTLKNQEEQSSSSTRGHFPEKETTSRGDDGKKKDQKCTDHLQETRSRDSWEDYDRKLEGRRRHSERNSYRSRERSHNREYDGRWIHNGRAYMRDRNWPERRRSKERESWRGERSRCSSRDRGHSRRYYESCDRDKNSRSRSRGREHSRRRYY